MFPVGLAELNESDCSSSSRSGSGHLTAWLTGDSFGARYDIESSQEADIHFNLTLRNRSIAGVAAEPAPIQLVILEKYHEGLTSIQPSDRAILKDILLHRKEANQTDFLTDFLKDFLICVM